MKNKIVFGTIGLALVVLMVNSQLRSVQAGWSGSMNGLGQGWASSSVAAAVGGAFSSTSTGNGIQDPSASISPTFGYIANGSLPPYASGYSGARIKGSRGYVWQANCSGANNDKADNRELELRIPISAASCPTLDMNIDPTQYAFDNTSGSGKIAVNATGTAGTALWLRGFEFTGDPSVLPHHDPHDAVNETVQYLLSHGGVQKFEALIVGPFSFDSTHGGCSLIIPFTLESKNENNLILITDGVAKSLPAEIPVLPDIKGECPVIISSAPTAANSCGAILTGTTEDPLEYHSPGTYTVHWLFDNGSISAEQKVIVTDKTAPVPDLAALPDATGECSATITSAPTATDACAGQIIGTTSDSLTRTTQGTSIVTWTFDDLHGNVSHQSQNIVVKDLTAPVPDLATLPDVTGECSATITTAPKATDNCSGKITGTTTDSLTRTTQGTSTVTWKYDDGHGKISYQTQKIVVTDMTAPVPDLATLPNVTGECSATITTKPTATDNCSGKITGTTTDSLTRSTQGTSTVTWKYDDGHGKVSYQTQKIVVKDVTAPAAPTLATVTGKCGKPVTLTAPKTTDNCDGWVTGTTVDPLTYSSPGTYTVHWKFTDHASNFSTANQTVVIKAIQFDGFEPPISGHGNDYLSPITLSKSIGSTCPIKFETECEDGYITYGQPTLKFQKYSTTGSLLGDLNNVNAAPTSNYWHYQWETSALDKNLIYKIIVTLQDGSTQSVFVKLGK